MNIENINPNLPLEIFETSKMHSHEIKDLSLSKSVPLREAQIEQEICLECTETLIPTQLDLELYELQRLYKQSYKDTTSNTVRTRYLNR